MQAQAPTPALMSPTRERWMILALAAVRFVGILNFVLMMPLGNQFMRMFEIGPAEFTWLVSSYTFSAGLMAFGSAFVMDRFDRKLLLQIGFAGFGLSVLLSALAETYIILLLARITAGVFAGTLNPLVLSIVGDAIPYERRGKAMGTVMAAFSVASVVGVPFGIYLAAQYSWHMPFFMLTAISVVVWVSLLLFVPPIRAHIDKAKAEAELTERKPNPFDVLKRVRENTNQQWALLLVAIVMMGQFTVVPFVAPFMEANIGFSQQEITYIYFFGGLATFFTSQWVGRLSDRWGKPRVFRLFMVLSIGMVLVITNLPPVLLVVAIVFTTFFFVFANGRAVPMVTMVTATVLPANRGSFMSLLGSVQSVAIGLGALISGMLMEQGPNEELIGFWRAGIVMACLALLGLAIAPRLRAIS